MFAPQVAGPHKKAAERTTGKLAPRLARAVVRPLGGLGREAGGDHEQEAVAGGAPDTETPRGRRWSLSGISILPPDATPPVTLQSKPPVGILQPKLAIGSVDDPLEHEADRIADHVMRMPKPDLPIGASPERLQMKPASLANAVVGEAPAEVHEALRSGGRPLDSATRAYFEPRYGHSFADVRIHDDSLASRSAEALGARAYAVGRDIVFGATEYRPGSKRGDRLLAHELAHVVQQSNGTIGAVVQRAEVGDQGQTASVTGGATRAVFAGSFNTPDSLGPIILSKNKSKPQLHYHCEYLPPNTELVMFLSRERGGQPNSDQLGTSFLDGDFTFETAVPAGTYYLRFEARSARYANIPRIKGNATLSA